MPKQRAIELKVTLLDSSTDDVELSKQRLTDTLLKLYPYVRIDSAVTLVEMAEPAFPKLN